MRSRSKFLPLLLALSVVLGACGGGDDDDNTEAADKQKTEKKQEGAASAADKNDINPHPRDELADGGTLTWPISQIPPNFNVHHLDGALADNGAVLGGLLSDVFDYDASASPTLNKDYFESVELTATTPKQIVTYRINPKAAWDDGTPITVAEFEAIWKARNGSNLDFNVASTQGYDKVESVVAGQDDREVVVTFASPYADWKGLFGGLYPAAAMRDPKVFNEGFLDRAPMSAGPFRWESLDKTAKTITVVRNDKWWGRRTKLDRIIFRAIDSDAQIGALANKEIDFIDVGPDVNKLKEAQRIKGVDLRRAAGPNFRHITINGTSPILSDVKVRQAVARAIKRDTIAEALISPLGVDAKPLNNHIFMSNQKGYRDNAGLLGKYDPEAADKLLDQAGWTRSGDVREKDGQKLELRMVIPTQVAVSAQEAQLVQAMLGAVGIKVNIKTVPIAQFFKEHTHKGNYDLTVFAWLGTVFPISSSRSIYKKPVEGPDGLEIEQNYARVGSDEIDALYEEATAEFDTAKAAALANRIDKLIWEEVHSITLYQRPEIVAIKSNIANFGASGFADTPLEDVGYLKS